MVMFMCSVLDLKYTFWTNLVKKKSKLFEMKVGTYTNSNMMNLVVMFICSTFDGKYPFWANLVRNVKTVSDKIWYLD